MVRSARSVDLVTVNEFLQAARAETIGDLLRAKFLPR